MGRLARLLVVFTDAPNGLDDDVPKLLLDKQGKEMEWIMNIRE